uniref:Apple domain-containing protein n=1 Tax=Daphnia galeata TaxID=27404 RepID=A0A8J2WTU6_9CRUS|nr:unnamed protein product [Daphnia galeata]
MLNKEMIRLCLVAVAVLFVASFPASLDASPKAMDISNNRYVLLAKQQQNKSSVVDTRCSTCTDDCPQDCGHVDTCPIQKPHPIKFSNLPSITYSTNCDFCDHDLYTLTCVERPSTCAELCAIDSRCSHFTYIANLKGGTCHLKKAFGSGGAWASSVPSPSSYVCGYIHSRALIGIFLDVCAGLDVTGTIRSGTA